ncbi:WD40 repeat-like protein [Exidia glandulosa HHB12029]|uniref:WD40 repeat-like protein n=1 Tax=Exidia glandulosa HHB12029 TaxID=1314781 RepID=A0A165JJQ5_EXIGL|nr:WD40 repeat-like protein [Exidia glandulosa HHB12029]
MLQTGLLPSAHTDLVTDAAYDFYGLKLATCGVDQRIKVWTQDENSGQWAVEDDWKAHDAPITSLSWAHPEYGTIVASTSSDRTTKVWERRHADANTGRRWVEVASLSDAKGAVRCAGFAPADFGLKLVTLASDNVLRLYECLESASGAQWELREELDMASPFLSTAPTPTVFTPRLALTAPSPSPTNDSEGGGWSLSWCKETYWGPCVAVCTPSAPFIRIIHLPPALRPQCVLSIPVQQGGPACVSWAPLLGRTHHLLACGSRDGHVRIFKLPAPTPGEGADWSYEPLADFDEHGQGNAVSKVEWNLTGTVLASSGHDGRVRLWKASYSNVWRSMGYVTAETSEDVPGGEGIEEEVED